MGLFSSIWNGVKSVSKTLLSAFNPFKDDDYKNASRGEQDRFKERIEVIAKDESLEHEYRMEAQRALAKIEAYRHAEEMAKIEGEIKITIAKIEATSSMTMAKFALLRTNLEHTSKKELALIRTIESTPNLAPQLLLHLEHASNEKRILLEHVNMQEDANRLYNNAEQSMSLISSDTKPKLNNNEWKEKLLSWARENQIPRRIIPRKLNRLLRVVSMDLTQYGIKELPIELAKLSNLKELKLANNHLTVIPDELAELVKLKQLDVRGNPLTKIPDALCNNKQLVILKET